MSDSVRELLNEKSRVANTSSVMMDTAATAAASIMMKNHETESKAPSNRTPIDNTQQRSNDKIDCITVPKTFDDCRLDRFLKQHYKSEHNVHVSVTQIQKSMRKKQILVNGQPIVEPSSRVMKNDRVTVPHSMVPQLFCKEELLASGKTHLPVEKKKTLQLTPKQEQEIRSWVLFKNDEIIVINKPTGIAVQGGSKQKLYVDGMLHALRFENNEDPKLVHRLDKDTSGVLVLARNRQGAHRMQQWLMDKSLGLKKCYWCIVAGKPKPSAGRIKNFVEKVSTKAFGEKVYVQPDKTENSKLAITEYKLIESVGESISWLAMYPMTGRLHQLRVHCATTLGTPILGDEKYGSGVPDSLRAMLLDSHEPLGLDDSSRIQKKRRELTLHLHARAMMLPYFDTKGQRITVTAPLPKHMKDTLDTFGISEKAGNKVTFK